MSGAGSNRLAVLAAEIQDADGRCKRNAKQAAAAAIEAGHKLIEAKALLPHGGWLPWLRDNATISERSARRYMQLAQSGMEIGHVADLGIREGSRAIAKTKRLHQLDPAARARAEEMFVVFWEMLIRYAHMPQARRRAFRMDTLDSIMSRCEEPEKLARIFLLKTQDMETLIATEGQQSIPGAACTDDELRNLAQRSVLPMVRALQ